MATGRLPDPNTAPLTAKGDLYTYSTVPARLAVGSNGDTLVADSAATTGLRWQSNFAAGKNKIINGDFYINQRAFISTTAVDYGFDRWRCGIAGSTGTVTFSAQTFTLGTAPVSGYEARNYIDIATTGQTAISTQTQLQQRIESVRTFAGQTVTISFWAKATSGTPKIAIELLQNFGTGGSPSASVQNYVGQVTLSTSWVRYSASFAVPSISGKTIGTDVNSDYLQLGLWTSAGSDFNSRTGSLGIQTATISIWGVQAEAGSVATAFQTATGTIQGELAAAMRYYQRYSSASPNSAFTYFGMGFAPSTTDIITFIPLRVFMRTAPTVGLLAAGEYNHYGIVPATIATDTVSNHSISLVTTSTGLTTRGAYPLYADSTNSSYIELSAEL